MANNVSITIDADAKKAEDKLKQFQANVRKAGLCHQGLHVSRVETRTSDASVLELCQKCWNRDGGSGTEDRRRDLCAPEQD